MQYYQVLLLVLLIDIGLLALLIVAQSKTKSPESKVKLQNVYFIILVIESCFALIQVGSGLFKELASNGLKL